MDINNANGLASNVPIDSNDEPPGNNQQSGMIHAVFSAGTA